jgi:hypothetical protein
MTKILLAQVPTQKEPQKRFYTFDKPCTNCLYGKRPLVSDERRKEILRSVKRKGGHFICHKATMQDKDVACAAWVAAGNTSQMFQVSSRLGLLQEVEQEESPDLLGDSGKDLLDVDQDFEVRVY